MNFELIIEEKIKTWRRNYVNVEADSLEEAVDKCVKFDSTVDVLESDYIYECDESIDSEDDITLEVMDMNHNVLKSV